MPVAHINAAVRGWRGDDHVRKKRKVSVAGRPPWMDVSLLQLERRETSSVLPLRTITALFSFVTALTEGSKACKHSG